MDETQLGLVALVAAGGAVGSVLRYVVSGALTRGDFPWGTFAVNLTGSLLLALLFFLFLQGGHAPPAVRTFLFLGVFGGFTTMSTFSLETVALFGEGQLWLGAANVALNGGGCVVGAFVGRLIGLYLGGA